MFSIPTFVSLLLLAVPKAVYADPCVTFDVDFNLLAFGFGGKDWNAGQQDTWTTGECIEPFAIVRLWLSSWLFPRHLALCIFRYMSCTRLAPPGISFGAHDEAQRDAR